MMVTNVVCLLELLAESKQSNEITDFLSLNVLLFAEVKDFLW